MTQPTGAPRGTPSEPPSPGADVGPGGTRRLAPAAVPSRPRTYLALLLLLPGGLLVLAGVFLASVGVGLCLPWLRRLSAAMGEPDTSRAATMQPHGASPDSGWRVPPSMEVH
jgi:hypothetical protein